MTSFVGMRKHGCIVEALGRIGPEAKEAVPLIA